MKKTARKECPGSIIQRSSLRQTRQKLLSLPYAEENKELTLKFLGSVYHISWPDFQVTHEEDDAGYYPLEEMHYAKILAIRFLLNGNVSQGSGRFKTYREMPWGEVYLRQFDGRCIKRLAFTYGNRLKDQMILWEGDDEFPPSSQILFSDNFPVSFAAEDMAVMGDVIIGSLKAFLKCL